MPQDSTEARSWYINYEKFDNNNRAGSIFFYSAERKKNPLIDTFNKQHIFFRRIIVFILLFFNSTLKCGTCDKV